MRFPALLLICLAYSCTAQAETIHRCADKSGKVSYSNAPCESGTSQVKTLEAAPAPTGATPDYKKQSRDFQQRHAERLKREQEEEFAAARKKREGDAARERQAAYEEAEKERLKDLNWPSNPYEKTVKEKTYIENP